MKKRIIVLDRDGTLIENVDYLSDKEGIKFLPNCLETLKLLNQLNYSLFIVTNQSGIGRGLISEHEYNEINIQLNHVFGIYDVKIVDIRHCPHKPESRCNCRKPKIDLGLQILQEYDVDLTHSFMIGDSLTDIEFGKSLGMQTILINEDLSNSVSDLVFNNWSEIKKFFKNY